MEIIKIGNVELTKAQVENLHSNNRYIVTYSKIYTIEYSNAQKQYYGRPIFHYPGMAKRGRFHTMSAAEVNRLIGFNLLNT